MNETRKLILKVLLVCLALAAGSGVLAVLSSSEGLGRVTGTAFIASVAALLMLTLSARLDKPATASAGVAGMVIVVIEFILMILMLWDIPQLLGMGRAEESIWVTCWLLFGFGVALMIVLRLIASDFTRIAGFTGLVLLALAMGAALIATWLPGPFYTHEQWWGTGWAIFGCGTLATVCLVGFGTPVRTFAGPAPAPAGSLRHWRWIGVIAALVAGAILIRVSWFSTGSDPTALILILIGGAFTGFANLVLLAPLKEPHRWLGIGTLVAGGVTACITAFATLAETGGYFGFERFIAAAAIPTACGSLALIVLTRLSQRTEFAVATSRELRITLVCPRCRKKQELALGGAACEGCGLRIEVKVEEPRCTQCGYMLYMLTGDHCPECGAAIDTPAAVTASPLS